MSNDQEHKRRLVLLDYLVELVNMEPTPEVNAAKKVLRRKLDAMQEAQRLPEVLADIARPPTSGFNKLGSAAQSAARSRAKAFYPFD